MGETGMGHFLSGEARMIDLKHHLCSSCHWPMRRTWGLPLHVIAQSSS